MSEIVILSGSPSESSRTDLVLQFVGKKLKQEGFTITHVSVRDIPSDDIFNLKFDSPAIKDLTSLIQGAEGVIVGSPVYKAAYTGVLKAVLDLLPQDVLARKTVLPIMTGGSPAHLLAIDFSLKPLLAALKGQSMQGVYFQDCQIDKTQVITPITDVNVLERLKKELYYFVEAVKQNKAFALKH
ncbi:NADPH-dependent FMN reductase [Fredinandcohnia sp. QZ13]|uniref:NADPH-dependent FMN reductase n=1 Tax=Fredinandcohnia sp. QZ13 TaxID=3073144 RepID=UPI002852F9A6|nr:NADPH-dependent FMN reductase [Fredinandcohnia sp. QZ13]MDR4887744.1 NADPH-dependent FMN reductase [Fredinandcohnia sp. QZ13]